jgi:hypothetical protein
MTPPTFLDSLAFLIGIVILFLQALFLTQLPWPSVLAQSIPLISFFQSQGFYFVPTFLSLEHLDHLF